MLYMTFSLTDPFIVFDFICFRWRKLRTFVA
jgi:hypothetical protein